MAETMMVVSGKGGVGKSTLCTGIAAGLARRGSRVLLIEGHMGFRCQDILLGLEGNTVFDFSDVAEGRCTPAQAILTHDPTGIRLLPAAADPAYLPRPEALAALCRQAGQVFDYILFDCGAGYDAFQKMLTGCCSMALLISTPDEAAVRAAGRVSGFVAASGLLRQLLIITKVPKVLPACTPIRDLDDVIDLVGARLIGAVPQEEFPPWPVRGRITPARREMDNIAGRLLGEDIDLYY